MKLRHPALMGLGGLVGTMAIRSWMRTLSYKAAYYDRSVDPIDPACQGQKLYLFWHEYILIPLAMRGHCNLAMLLSRHQDAEILSRAAPLMGFETIRGSTGRGGVTALRTMLRKSQEMHLTMVPDGPRGPRRVMAPGPIYLASKLQIPLVLMGLGLERPWRLNSWDRFAIPKPGTRARGVISPAITLPPDLDRGGIEHYRVQLQRLLNQLTGEAEQWAASGQHMPGECNIHQKGNAPLRSIRRIDRASTERVGQPLIGRALIGQARIEQADPLTA